MTARIDWFGFAEGAATDSRGVPSLIGFSPASLVFPEFPAMTGLALVVHLIDDEDPPVFGADKRISMNLAITGPDGVELIRFTPELSLGNRKDSDVVQTATAIFQAQLTLPSPGRYLAKLTAAIADGDFNQTVERPIHIVHNPAIA